MPIRVSALALLVIWALPGADFMLRLRTCVEPFKGSGVWQEAQFERRLDAPRTAVVVCDMWDHHWCGGAERREALLVPRMTALLTLARSRGMLIVHAPSDTMQFYKEYPQRRWVLSLAPVAPPPNLTLDAPPLPIDDSDGGCDSGQRPAKPYPWSRQHAGIPIAEGDAITDKGAEVYTLLRARDIRDLIVMGVHANMCILNRTFAIKQMTRWGVPAILVRDMTDAMYNPQQRPFVSHERGTEMVIEHIEKFWCPTTLSADLTAALKPLPAARTGK